MQISILFLMYSQCIITKPEYLITYLRSNFPVSPKTFTTALIKSGSKLDPHIVFLNMFPKFPLIYSSFSSPVFSKSFVYSRNRSFVPQNVPFSGLGFLLPHNVVQHILHLPKFLYSGSYIRCLIKARFNSFWQEYFLGNCVGNCESIVYFQLHHMRRHIILMTAS